MIHQEKEQLQIAYEKADMESKTKTEFMNRMSHDLRTPINGILGMIQVIRKSWNNQEKLEDSVNKIEISCDGKNVLYEFRIEDSGIGMSREYMEHEFYLTDAGIIVEKAWNGKEAVEKYEGTPKGYYSAILMDIMMLVMNGIEVARNIRRKEKNGGKEIPIIAMTAQSERESKESCSLAGMNAYISKPVDPENLIRILRMYQKR